MGKTFTPINLLSYSEISESISVDVEKYDFSEFDYVIKFIEENTRKVPKRIVDNVINFANNYS
ncbi:MAG: hypothetical protein KOO66_13320 [Bacteroidales bacterium]|nr:hypothetical protein [Bacteroidales bacterium]